MPDTQTGSGRFAVSDGDPIERDGRELVFDVSEIGNTDDASSGSSGGGSGGSRYNDGYGDAGAYGKGRFPDGRSRKKSPRGSGAGQAGTETVSSRKPRSARKAVSIDPSGIERILLAIHFGIAGIAREPALALQPEQATLLGKAIADVARHYPQLETSQKIIDHGNLIICAASIYVPMAIMVAQSRAQRRQEAMNGA